MIIWGTPFDGIVFSEIGRTRTIMMIETENMMQTQRHHIIHTRFPTPHHHGKNRIHGICICQIKRLHQPLFGNFFRFHRGIPCQTTECIPVGLREMMTTPIGVFSDVGNTSYTFQLLRIDKLEKLFPHGSQIYQMPTLSKVFLRNLQLSHLRCLLDIVENRSIRFTWLEIQRTVLGLQDNIIHKLTIQRFKF